MNSFQSFSWPNGCQCAISLTFDDGMRSQLDVAVPRLEERGFCGTFYVNPRGDAWLEALVPWQSVQAAGHEIGNHTMAHPCNLNTDPTLLSWTLDMIEADVRERFSKARESALVRALEEAVLAHLKGLVDRYA